MRGFFEALGVIGLVCIIAVTVAVAVSLLGYVILEGVEAIGAAWRAR